MVDPVRTYALVVGIDRYDAGTAWDLAGPSADARRFAQWLLRHHVPPSQIVLCIEPAGEAPEVPELPATRDGVRRALLELSQREGDLLFFFWGGHGVIGDGERTRRLFFSNATVSDKQNLDVDDLLGYLRSMQFKGFERQICMIDACANFVEDTRSRLPFDSLPPTRPRSPEPSQFVLFAARAGESAKNVRRTGELSSAVLDLLVDKPLLPDMAELSQKLTDRFDQLRQEGKPSQTPIYWYRRRWTGKTDSNQDSLGLREASLERSATLGMKSRAEVLDVAGKLVSPFHLEALYRRCLPSLDLFVDQATSLRAILLELDNLHRQQGGAFPFPLLHFVELVALQVADEFPSASLALQGWVDQAATQLSVHADEVRALRGRLRPLAGDSGLDIHVLVDVIPDGPSADMFSLAAWFWSEGRGFEPINLLPEDSGPMPLPDVEQVVTGFLERLPDLWPEDTTLVNLEFFLPRNLLCWGVDQLGIRRASKLRPVGIHHPLVVRWRDRALKRHWDLYWKPKWRHARNLAASLPANIFWLRSCEQLGTNALYAQLIASDQHVCLGLAFTPPEKPEPDDLVDTLLEAGTPVAFWLRSAPTDPELVEGRLCQAVAGHRVTELPQAILAARQAAYGGDDNQHPGHCLTLLWDDAERRLPGAVWPLVEPRIEGGRLL